MRSILLLEIAKNESIAQYDMLAQISQFVRKNKQASKSLKQHPVHEVQIYECSYPIVVDKRKRRGIDGDNDRLLLNRQDESEPAIELHALVSKQRCIPGGSL